MKKPKITAKKLTDDRCSWAVLINNKICFSGLNRSSVPYYKSLALETYIDNRQSKQQNVQD
jgi:hypothetical protein